MKRNRYVVWSQVLVNDQPVEVIEVSRSDRKVAELDVDLIRMCGHRKAWVQDTEETK